MARILITFDGGDVPIVMGGEPVNAGTPIGDPVATGFKANHAFIVADGVYCYGLDTRTPHAPLWQVVQAVNGTQATAAFVKII